MKIIDAFSGFSVKSIAEEKKFYSEILGIECTDTMQGITLHIAGSHNVFVYEKPDHVPATYTVLNLVVDDIDQAVDELISRGVVFEKYDEGYLKTDSKGISRGDGVNGPTMAWFKDPSGNFNSVLKN